MNLSVPLPPHVEQFIRQQLASGLFQSENDIVLAALRLLEGQSQSCGTGPARLIPNFDKGLIRKPSTPISQEFSEAPRKPVQADRARGNEGDQIPSTRRSPRGLLADVCSDITFDDLKDARREMWSGFPHGEA